MKTTIRRITSCETVVLGLDASVAALAALEHPFSLLESEKDADTALTEAKTMPLEEKRTWIGPQPCKTDIPLPPPKKSPEKAFKILEFKGK